MQFVITAIIFFTGAVIFSLSAGIILFRDIFVRKPETSSSFKKDLPGIPEEFTTHTRDPKIMDPLLDAKREWNDSQYEKVFIMSAGIKLAGYLRLTSAEAPVALLMHGYCDSAAGLAYLSREYEARGTNVLAVDCRGHGVSEGKNIGMGYSDARDLVNWVEFLKERFGSGVKIILHGISMGAAAVYLYSGLCEASRKKQYENVICLIGDCGFSSYSAQMKSRIRHIIKGKIQAPVRAAILTGASIICRIRCGFFFFQIEPVKAVKKRAKTGFSEIPLIIFQGTEDVLVSKEMAKEIYAAAAGKKELVLVQDAPHIGSYFYDTEGYFKVIEKAAGLKK